MATFQRNISQHCWVQHVAHVWPPCSVPAIAVADVLRHVGCCWLKIENGWIFHETFMDIAWCCNRLARFVQQCCSWTCALVRFYNLQDVATRCNRLAKRTQHVAPNNVAICCFKTLRAFGWGFKDNARNMFLFSTLLNCYWSCKS